MGSCRSMTSGRPTPSSTSWPEIAAWITRLRGVRRSSCRIG